MFAHEVDAEVFGSRALGDVVQWFTQCFSVTFHLLCCCRPAAASSIRRTRSIAEYMDAPSAVASNMAQPGSDLERSRATASSLMVWHAREGQALLKPGHGSTGRLSRTGAQEGPHGQEMLGMGAPKEKEGLELDFANDEDCCPTCLELFSPEDPAIETRCHHKFHLQCMLVWYERQQTCPVCLRKIDFKEMEAALQ